MHSHALRKLILLLQRSRRDLCLVQGKPAPISKATVKKTRRDFVKSTATAGVAAGLLSTSLPKAFAFGHKAPRIAIIGAGVAGLNAAYQLRKAGLKANVYEASNRLGGRIHSLQNALGMDLTVELGGELINTDHDDMLMPLQALLKMLRIILRENPGATMSSRHCLLQWSNRLSVTMRCSMPIGILTPLIWTIFQ